jgi:2-polyprenyl-3-methyl-5-hydroxy-6-metoxy-1,4-benzoquinol methylase
MQVERLGWSEDHEHERDDPDNSSDHIAAGVVGAKKRRHRDERESGALNRKSKKKLKRGLPAAAPRVLEVGAGCGLLGLVIANMGADVVLTEAAEAMDLLSDNVGKVMAACCRPATSARTSVTTDPPLTPAP